MTIPHYWTSAAGYGAAFLTTTSLVPQLVRIWRRKSADDISTVMYSLFSAGSFLWLVYGVLLVSWPMMLANGVTLAFSLSVLGLKLYFADHQRALAAKQRASATVGEKLGT
jgi:MtN3 and saliva related transmembrane protein